MPISIERMTKLEQDAETIFATIPKFAPFPTENGAKYSCPWLHYWQGLNQPAVNLEGIFIMQDWGFLMQDTALDREIELIETALSGQKTGDATLDNLAMTDWCMPIKNGRWLVTNAVWGLRTSKNKCGYLGDSVHRKSYSVWSRMIEFFATQNPKLNLVVSGEWARFSEQKVGFKMNLREYMDRWEGWSNGGSLPISRWKSLQGLAYHCHHPSTWRWTNSAHNPQVGPP